MASYRIYILFFIIISQGNHISAQNLYKTPSGKRYHLATCRMVETVSQKLNGQKDVERYGLEPCKICKPPQQYIVLKNYSKKKQSSRDFYKINKV